MCDPVGYVVDCEVYCEHCIGDAADDEETGAIFSWDERDSPTHCSNCHRFLDYGLTSHGVDYVLEKIRSMMSEPLLDRFKVPLMDHGPYGPDGYYRGSPHHAIVSTWARKIWDYSLGKSDKLTVKRYLDIHGWQYDASEPPVRPELRTSRAWQTRELV